MYDIAVEDGFRVSANEREYNGSQDSKFLNVEAPKLQSVIPMRRLFNQCSDYKTDIDFVNQPYTQTNL